MVIVTITFPLITIISLVAVKLNFVFVIDLFTHFLFNHHFLCKNTMTFAMIFLLNTYMIKYPISKDLNYFWPFENLYLQTLFLLSTMILMGDSYSCAQETFYLFVEVQTMK